MGPAARRLPGVGEPAAKPATAPCRCRRYPSAIRTSRRRGRVRAGHLRLGVLQGAFDGDSARLPLAGRRGAFWSGRPRALRADSGALRRPRCLRVVDASLGARPLRGHAASAGALDRLLSLCMALLLFGYLGGRQGLMSSSRGRPVVFLAGVGVFLLVFVAVAEVWLRTVTPASETRCRTSRSGEHSQVRPRRPADRPDDAWPLGAAGWPLAHQQWRLEQRR